MMMKEHIFALTLTNIDKEFYKDTIMAYKSFNDLASSYLTNKFIKRSGIYNRFTRNCASLDIPVF